MYNYKDIFYSFSLDEVSGFEEIKKAVEELSYIPEDFTNELVYNHSGKEIHARLRESLESGPNVKRDLQREAKMNLHKVLPILKEGKFNSVKDKKWGLRPGHICFNNAFRRLEKLHDLVNDLFDFECEVAGDFLYPPNGFRIWHTNKYDLESWFVFFVDTDKEGQSFFKFVDSETNEVITHWDEPMSMNIFRINTTELFWHCIGTKDCNRWSQGFSLPNNWKEKIEL